MIVSHKNKYVFIQFPHTACTAVGRELVEYYDGEPMLFKHAAYHDYLRVATHDMKQYFVFSSIRNPVDELISFYFKLKTNHGEDFTDPERLKKNGGWVTPRILKRYKFIQENNADFSAYLSKFYKMPHVNWSILDHKKFDHIIRYENLQGDFSNVLKKLKINQMRPLPLVNPTKKGNSDLVSLLNDKEREQLSWVASPLMNYWDYPSLTNDIHHISFRNAIAFDIMCIVKVMYWRQIRHRL
jgi:hypothetical protein